MALAQPKSDVAALWEEALDDYKKDTATDIRDHLTSPHNIESIKASGTQIFIELYLRSSSLLVLSLTHNFCRDTRNVSLNHSPTFDMTKEDSIDFGP
jgi:hypothetical protein